MNVIDLPDCVIAKVFEWLDIRSRVRCEAVCGKFRDLASQIYGSHPWNGFPKGKITLVISSWCRLSDYLSKMDNIGIEDGGIRITILDRGKDDSECGLKRRHEWYAQMLDSILTKFISCIGSLELHNAELNSKALELLLIYRNQIESLKVLGCRFTNASVIEVARCRAAYGERLTTKAKCGCGRLSKKVESS